MTEQAASQDGIGRHFDDTEAGTVRRYWFVGGLGAGVLASGGVLHWGIDIPPVGLIVLGGVILFSLLTMKQRGDWDV